MEKNGSFVYVDKNLGCFKYLNKMVKVPDFAVGLQVM